MRNLGERGGSVKKKYGERILKFPSLFRCASDEKTPKSITFLSLSRCFVDPLWESFEREGDFAPHFKRSRLVITREGVIKCAKKWEREREKKKTE